MDNERVACSSKVAKTTIDMLNELHDWSHMTKGELVDLAITDLYNKKKADKSLMVYIKDKKDREFILKAINDQYIIAYQKVLEDIKKHYH